MSQVGAVGRDRPAPPPPAGSRGRRTYEAILDAVERLLTDGGYPAATTTAVAEEAGVATGTVYLYVDDRDELLAAAFRRRLEELIADLETTLTADALLDDGLDEVLHRALGVVLDHYGAHAATLRTALAHLPASPRIRTVYWEAHARTEAVLVPFVRRAQTAGAIRQADAEVLARTLLVIVQGANDPLLLGAPRSPQALAIRAELERALVALLAAPAGVRPPDRSTAHPEGDEPLTSGASPA